MLAPKPIAAYRPQDLSSDGAGGLQGFQRKALLAFLASEKPIWRRSKWWKTDLGSFDPAELTPTAPATTPSSAVGNGLTEEDGRWVSFGLPPAYRQPGVVVTDFATAFAQSGPLLAEYLGVLLPSGAGRYEAMNDAFLASALFIHLPRGFRAEEPLRLNIHSNTGGLALGRRLLLIAEEDSHFELEVNFGGQPASDTWASHLWELYLGAQARGRLTVVAQAGSHLYGYAREAAQLGTGAELEWNAAQTGGAILRLRREAFLAGQGASYRETAVYLGQGGSVYDLTSISEHREPHTRAEVLYKGTLLSGAEASFEGILRVRPGSHGAESHLQDHILTLATDTKYDTIPSLEIEDDDVRISHGASISRLDPEEIFYLMARGLPAETARELIVRGFFEAALQRFPEVPHAHAGERIAEAIGR